MTRGIGDALASATGIYHLDCSHPTILDLCMAPGGFSLTSKNHLPNSVIDAVTLPPDDGGYQVMAKGIFRDIVYADITMFAQEMAPGSAIPTGHPELTKFESTRPFLGNRYDIVFCGGAVGKNHPRAGYRENCEGSRLTISELVFALNRLKSGGSLVLLLHRVESWDTACLIHAFNHFLTFNCSNIKGITPLNLHSIWSRRTLIWSTRLQGFHCVIGKASGDI
jgi:23S rRNA U2552 (ribose-2'-O)-methylase RlmE/FtsJ